MRTIPSLIALVALATSNCGTPSTSTSTPTPTPTSTPPPTSTSTPAASPAVKVPIEGLPLFGDDRALVTIVAFMDFECPYSAKAMKTLDGLRGAYGDRLRVAIAPRPLPMHDDARPLALAFLAAHEQRQAESFARAVFEQIPVAADAAIAEVGRRLRLDPARFSEARSSPRIAQALAKMEALASSLDATGTPTFFINGRRLMGAQKTELFRSLIDEELERAAVHITRGALPTRVYDAVMANAAPFQAKPATPPESDRVFDVPEEGAPFRGPARAPVTIVLFADYECHYCARFEAKLMQLEAEYRGNLKVSLRHRPLPVHENARVAAKAAIAADAQGEFWEFHRRAIAHQDTLDRASLVRIAGESGIDPVRFERDLDDPVTDLRVTVDETLARSLDVRGTPTSFVNGRRLLGDQPIATLRAAIDRALEERR